MDHASNDIPVDVYMIGNAHIDPVWLWPMSEGRAEVQASYRTAIMLIEAYDAYVFTSGGAVTYQWVAEDDPALFRAIQKAVAQGKWALVNGWWLQPDCNIPGGESFARHALYGQRYLTTHFGQRARVGYNVDSFGHAGTLPQLLKLGGLEEYVFFRPGPHEKELPQGPFWWEAPDGTRMLTCRPPLHYNSPGDGNIVARMTAAAAGAPPGLPLVMCFYGVGNHGGGPTRREVEAVMEAMQTSSTIRPIFASPQAYFDQVQRHPQTWPVVHDDLQHHARGCYTALSRVKRENRQAEHALMRAERLGAWAHLLCQAPDPCAPLQEAWQGVLFNQFHDIMAGTSLRDAYDDVWRNYAKAQQTAQEIQEKALAALGARVHVPDKGQAVLVWNPLAWERTEAVLITHRMGGWRHDVAGVRCPGQPQVQDEAGNALPCQITDVELDYNTYVVHLEARVTAPALGASLLYVTVPEVDPLPTEPQPVHTDILENEFYRLRIDPDTGWIVSLFDRERQVELLAGPANVPLVIHDPSDTWSHDVPSFRDVCGRFTAQGPAELIHDGPVQRTLRVRLGWGRSSIIQDITLQSGVRAIDVRMTVDWHEQLKMLKVAFPLALDQVQVTASAPYGCIARRANGEEEPCQSWVDVSGSTPAGAQGLCLLNDSKYGYDVLDSELRLSILRSPIYAFHQPRIMAPGITYHYIDQGQQVVHYRLLPHLGTWETSNPARSSLELHEPLIARAVAPHPGDGRAASLLRIAPANVALTTVKLAEEDGRLIVRGYETLGQPAHLVLASDVLDKRWEHDLRPHEIWTLALPLDGGQPIALNLLEEPIR